MTDNEERARKIAAQNQAEEYQRMRPVEEEIKEKDAKLNRNRGDNKSGRAWP